MQGPRFHGPVPLAAAAALLALGLPAPPGHAACCYFAAKDKDIQQPAQKVFITWDPVLQRESFTVQPRFEGSAEDFGMVVPTPAKPQLDEMPRDFFKELAVFTILKNREQPQSQLLPAQGFGMFGGAGGALGLAGGGISGIGGGIGGLGFGGFQMFPRPPQVKVVETGLVGSLNYKILTAQRADDLYDWLKDNKYHYAGDEATLDFYVRKRWHFTVMKIDTLQMKRGADGRCIGEVTPTRFQFSSAKLVYPMKITQLSVKDKTEALFYVQAPYKVDLPEDNSYQFQWVPLLENAQGWYQKGAFGANELPGKGDRWLRAIKDQTATLHQRGEELGYAFVSGQRPTPNKEGRLATTLEWAKQLTASDISLLRGKGLFSEKVPNVDAGFRVGDTVDPRRAQVVYWTIQQRLKTCQQTHPGGYLVREAPAEDVKQLDILLGHLSEGQFLTKFRKTFIKAEMNDDLQVVPARLGAAKDSSEYTEILPSSPP